MLELFVLSVKRTKALNHSDFRYAAQVVPSMLFRGYNVGVALSFVQLQGTCSDFAFSSAFGTSVS